jgi:peptide/nickel transport system ATP-binding protein
MLNPLMPCGAQIAELITDERGRRLGQAARREQAVRRLAEVGITDPAVADAYPFELSGGMRQRVGIAAAIARDPQVLIADEPSTALDVTTQREILARLREVQQARGMGLIMITHDLRVAFALCDRVLVLYAGSVLETAAAAQLEAEPLHPYTLGLLLSDPPVDRRLDRMAAIPGSVPTPDQVASSCAFAPRCQWRAEACTQGVPPLAEVAGARWSACLRIPEITPHMQEARGAAETDQAAQQATAEEQAAEAVRPGVVVAVRDLEKVFGDKRQSGRRVAALKGVSLEIGENEAVGLVGESGSGKTTLGRCLVGLESPTAGTVVVNGTDTREAARLSSAERRKLRRTVQMVFQDPYSTLNPVRTVGATLAEALTADGQVRDVRSAVTELLERVGLPGRYAERKPVALSGGERQRVAVARALAVRPRLIVCDEPVSALDVSVQAQILNLLTEVRRELGVSYLFITHDLAVVRQVAERVYVLRQGEVVEQGATGDVLDHPQHWYTRMLVESIPSSEEAWLAQAALDSAELNGEPAQPQGA